MLRRRALDAVKLLLMLMVLLLLPACSSDPAASTEASVTDEAEIMDQDTDELSDGGMTESRFEFLGDEDGITMVIPEDTLNDSGSAITVTNSSSQTCTFGTYYCLETEIDGIWYALPFAGWAEDEIGWEDLGYEVGPRGDQFSIMVDWEWLYGELEPGRYRIVKDLFYSNNWQEKYYISAEFVIEE